jgi:RNA polymerase sigma factor (sigma-70 family)
VSATVEALFLRFLEDGDEAALDLLFRRCSPPLFQLARRLGRGAADAEDLVQETMVAAIAAAGRWDSARPLLPWLKGILARKAAQLAREDMRRQRLQDELHAHRAAATSAPAVQPAAAADQELRQALDRALAELPEKYREPLALHLLEGRTPQEVAAAMGRSRATVRVQLYRGMRLLRQKLPHGPAGALVVFLGAEAAAQPGSGTWSPLPRSLRPSVLRSLRLPLLAAAPVAAAAALWVWWPGPGVATTTPVTAAPELRTAAARPLEDGAAARTESPGPGAGPHAAVRALRIQVVDAAGQGLPAVGIRAAPAAGLDPVPHERRTVTAADGAAILSLPADGWLDGVTWHVATDRGPAATVDPAHAAEFTLRVAGGLAVRGRVVDPARRPVAGALVWLGDEQAGPWSGTDVATTDAAGTFALAAVPAGSFLAARHAALGRSPVARVAAGGPELELTLVEPGGRVAVVVRDAQGDPLGDALVLVGDAMAAAPLRLAEGAAAWRPPPLVLRTDAQGLAASACLEPGVHPVFVRAAGHAPWAGHVQVAKGTGAELPIQLRGGARLVAAVTGPDRRPVPGAQLVCRGLDRHGDVDAITDGEGRVRLDCLPLGEVRLAARAPGLRPRTLTVELAAGVTAERELTLDQQPQLRCQVLDAEGKPLAGARVRAVLVRGSSLEDDHQVVELDQDGTAILFADAGRRTRLELAEVGAPLWRDVSAFMESGRDGVVVRLPPGFAARSWLLGTLADAHGHPIAAARLHLTLESSDGEPPGGAEGARQLEVGTSDREGGFRIGPLPAGEFELFAESTTSTSPSAVVGTFALAPGESRRLGFRAPAAGVVDFALRRRDGGEIGDVVVTVVGETPPRRQFAAMEPVGRRQLVPGAYRLYAMGSRVRWLDGHPFTVRAGEETRIELVLEPATLRTLWLVGLPAAAGGSVARGRVLRLPGGEEMGSWPVALDAPTPLGAVLPVGSFEIQLRGPAGEELTGRFEVTDLLPGFSALRVPLARR